MSTSQTRLFIKLIPITLFGLFLAACKGGGQDAAGDPNAIDTLNVLFVDQKILSFDPGRQQTRGRAEFAAGEVKIFAMNTNDDKQGYEHAAYVYENDIWLFNYVSGRTTKLATINQDVCGIFPNLEPSIKTFERNGINQIFINRPSLFISTTSNTVACAPETNQYFKLEFDIDQPTDISISQVSSAQVIGDVLLNYEEEGEFNTTDEPDTEVSTLAFLGYDAQSEEVELYVNGEQLLQSSLPFVSRVPTIQQVTEREVLIQRDNDIYIMNVNGLAETAKGSSDSALPSFDLSALTPTTVTDELDLSLFAGDDTFVIADGSNMELLSLASSESTYEIDSFSSLNVNTLSVSATVTPDNEILLLREEATQSTLSWVSTVPDPITGLYSETTLINAADINFFTVGDEIYINALDPEGLGDNVDGWNAITLDSTEVNSPLSTHDRIGNAMFAQFRAPLLTEDKVLLLRSELSFVNDQLDLPSLYLFENNEQTSLDNDFGAFGINIKEIRSATYINDLYAHIVVVDDSDQETHFYFDPTDQDDPSLILIEQ